MLWAKKEVGWDQDTGPYYHVALPTPSYVVITWAGNLNIRIMFSSSQISGQRPIGEISFELIRQQKMSSI